MVVGEILYHVYSADGPLRPFSSSCVQHWLVKSAPVGNEWGVPAHKEDVAIQVTCRERYVPLLLQVSLQLPVHVGYQRHNCRVSIQYVLYSMHRIRAVTYRVATCQTTTYAACYQSTLLEHPE